jgi:large subunit ribosomal protein L10
MDNPRPDKVAKVAELEQHFEDASAVLLTEYRGLDVLAMAELRDELRTAGADYKIYKNTLVRIAARQAGLDLDALLTGPTAIAFVSDRADGTAGDAAAAAKALRDFVKKNDALVLKGGVVDGATMSVDQLKVLADLPSRDVLLAQIAGALAAPMQQFAGLLQAMPRNLAYGIKALIDTMPAEPAAEAPAEEAAPAADDTPAEEASDTQTDAAQAEPDSTEADSAEAEAAEAPDETTDQTDSPAAEATTDETPADAGSEQEK